MDFKKLLSNSAPFAIRTLWVCFIGGPTIWLIGNGIRFSGLNPSEAAAWIQAIGSIGAIVGACAVANWQILKSQKQRDQEKAGRLRAIVAVVHNAAKQAEAIGQMVERHPPDFALRGAWGVVLSGPLLASQQALNAVPMHELDDPDLVVHCVSIMGSLARLIEEMEIYMSTEPGMERKYSAYSAIKIQAINVAFSWHKFQVIAVSKSSSPRFR